MSDKKRNIHRLRVTAKVWSILSIAFVLTIFVGETLSGTPPAPTAQEWIGLTFFPIGVMIGLALAWQREGIGGTVSVLSLLAFYIWDLIRSGDLPGGPFFFLVAAPGILFLICWYLSRNEREAHHA